MTDKNLEISNASQGDAAAAKPAGTASAATENTKPEASAAKPAPPQPGAGASAQKPGPATSVPPTAKKPEHPAPPRPAARRPGAPWAVAFIVAALLVLALAAALWYQQQEFKRSNAMLEGQVRNSISAANQASDQAQQALSLAQDQSRQLAALDGTVRDSREQFDELIQAFQTLTDSSSDLVLINDVDHLATIAQQQLQLGGNVANAIISLETAQAQLARANRPSLASLQETINGDLDRLRAATPVDVSFLTGQLEELGNLVSEAPLLVPDDAAPEPVPAPESAAPAAGAQSNGVNADAPWWKQGLQTAQDWSRSAWDSVRQDLGQFITVRRVDDATALLVSPDQATRFRETLRLRVMTAQLALMMRQPKVWQAETEKLVQAVQARYDSRSAQSRQALKIARQLADTSIDVKLPSVANTLQALEALREAEADDAGRSPGEQAPADTQPDPSIDDGPANGAEPAATEAVPASGPDTDPAVGQPDSSPDQDVRSATQPQV